MEEIKLKKLFKKILIYKLFSVLNILVLNNIIENISFKNNYLLSPPTRRCYYQSAKFFQ